MSERAAQWTASTLADVRADGWMCGTQWDFFFLYHDVLVMAYACTACPEQALGHLRVERTERVPVRAADVPVAFGDVDLFGYPINELSEVLDPSDRKLLLPASANLQSTNYLSAVSFDACDGERRTPPHPTYGN
ncbi:hypothetical protein KDL01_27740 [Actinospica durhamensis]|uniref:Uncharacterized protein n=1 Tax=Actinospica durhamensis TaxID=1508375 RepID=A0A941IVF7_9ACTN|nr:hypothetical protein [Actinospica durhamensis]MBR7837101.1 hypothetical protein [Actinospica durhamensis]